MFSIWFVSTLNCQRINSGIWILLPFEAWSWSWLFLLWAYCFPRFLSFNVWLWLTAIDFNWRLLTLNDETAIDLSFSAKMQLTTNKKNLWEKSSGHHVHNALTASARDFSRFFGMFWDVSRCFEIFWDYGYKGYKPQTKKSAQNTKNIFWLYSSNFWDLLLNLAFRVIGSLIHSFSFRIV